LKIRKINLKKPNLCRDFVLKANFPKKTDKIFLPPI